ncbi:MAG: glycosyltransferase family 4 protein [Candidatus Limnocylindrales bacterium]
MTGSDPSIVAQRLVIVLPSTAQFDSRTYRIASFCAGRGHEVTVLARWAPGLARDEVDPAGYRIIRVPAEPFGWVPRRLRRRLSHPRPAADGSAAERGAASSPVGRSGISLGRRLQAAIGGTVRLAAIVLTIRAQGRACRAVDPGGDLYHGMAYMGIPIARSLARRRRAQVVYDARDIYVDAGNVARLPGPVRRLIGHLERGWARSADRVVTVNEPYADVMASRWGLEQPLIVMNCSYRYQPATPRDRRFHRVLDLASPTPVVLYQGGFSSERGIEQLIDAIRLVPGAVLVLMGYGPLENQLTRRAADPALGGRVRILPAVPPADLLDWIAAADIVAMPIQPSTLNHRLTTPNKLFEALAAGVPVIASDLPGMASIVLDHGAGVLVDPTDPTAIGAAIARLLEDSDGRAAMGERALAAAHGPFNWEAQAARLIAEYGRLTGRPW